MLDGCRLGRIVGDVFCFSVGLNGTVHLLVPVTTLRMEYFMFSPSSSKGCFDFM